MSTGTVHRDERTEAVENASYRLAYLVVSFGLLAAVVYRALALDESSWDLIALVVIGGLAATVYQGRRGVLTSRWMIAAVGTAVGAAVLAGALSLLLGPR